MSDEIEAAVAKFQSSIPSDCPAPTIIGRSKYEITLEWIDTPFHAIVSFDEDGTVGYAMRYGARFEPGSEDASTGFPSDLRAYLAAPA